MMQSEWLSPCLRLGSNALTSGERVTFDCGMVLIFIAGRLLFMLFIAPCIRVIIRSAQPALNPR